MKTGRRDTPSPEKRLPVAAARPVVIEIYILLPKSTVIYRYTLQ
jgi:hypothetical protein